MPRAERTPIADLRELVSIMARVETDDGHDGYTVTYTVLSARVPAAVRPLLGRELERARAVDPRAQYEIVLRWWSGHVAALVGGRTRVLWHPTSTAADDRILELVTPAVDVEGRRESLTMLAREAV